MALLYFDPVSRWQALNLIDVYSNEVTSRVLAAFENIEAEANSNADAYFEQKMNEPAWDDGGFDEEEIAESADEFETRRYFDLQFVKREVTGLAIAGLYHLWERILKNVFERHSVKATSKDFGGVMKLLTRYGWDVNNANFYTHLNHLRLVTNVIKHGNGPACNELLTTAPEMFREAFSINPSFSKPRKAEHLELKKEDFGRFVGAVREFFEQFPAEMKSGQWHERQ